MVGKKRVETRGDPSERDSWIGYRTVFRTIHGDLKMGKWCKNKCVYDVLNLVTMDLTMYDFHNSTDTLKF